MHHHLLKAEGGLLKLLRLPGMVQQGERHADDTMACYM
jgi:hypothetical protein